jgi:general secretion pathway protein A
MYKDFYKFNEFPFNITSDPEFFFASSKHVEAFNHLIYGIQQRKGIIVISGEIGTGKTMLCRSLLRQLDDSTKTAFILNPSFTELQLLQMILKDLGIHSSGRNKFELINALNEFLLAESSLGNNVLLIIDEAQNLNIRQLEQIRLLSNLETEKNKLLQILLVGQPELIEHLKLPQLRQLNQRVSVRYHIMPLTLSELHGYINHRLKIATNSEFQHPIVKFTDDAIAAIHDLSGGTPRMVNIISDRSLLAGFVAETQVIDKSMVYKCAREVVHQ